MSVCLSALFDQLRAQAPQDDLPAPDESLIQGMIEYASKSTGKSPELLRQQIVASQGNNRWRTQKGYWLMLGDLEVSPRTDLHLGGGRRIAVQPLVCGWSLVGAGFAFARGRCRRTAQGR